MPIHLLRVPSSLAVCFLVAAAAGCTTTATTTPDGGNPDKTGDGSSAAGALGFSPSNVADVLGTLDLSQLTDIVVEKANDQLSVDCNSNPGCQAAVVTQSDGTKIQLYVANSWSVLGGGVLSVLDKMPVVLVAIDSISIDGQIDASASADETVGGGFAGSSIDVSNVGGPGEGLPGANSSTSAPAIGGGGGSFCGVGGAGGGATATIGGPGKAYGAPALVPLVPGSAGGFGDLPAGGGGGAIELVAGTAITITSGGVISVGGGGGNDGTDSGSYSASGGGSGGAILLEAPTVSVAGLLEANGGGGGGGVGAPAPVSNATVNANPAAGGAAGTSGVGGTGAGGGTTSGGPGAAGDAVGQTVSAGAGGGGAGYIRINTMTGHADLTGAFSPGLATPCVSQGTLAP